MMKIGIDGRSLNTNRAIARYSKNLLNQLSRIDPENEYHLFVEGPRQLSDFAGLSLSPNWHLVKSPPKFVFRDHFLFGRFVSKFNLDLFFHPDNTEFLYCHPKSVVTIHDLIPYLFPHLSLSPKIITRLRQRIYLYLQRQAVKKSSGWVIAVSQNTRRDLEMIFGLRRQSITVVYEAAQANYFPQAVDKISQVKKFFKIEGNYIFVNSGFSPYKNVLPLVEVFAKIVQNFPALSLVLGGSFRQVPSADEAYYQKVLDRVKQLNLGGKVIFTDYVDEAYLPSLYSGAQVFVYPSLYEGFGIPLIEAQACGVPVLAADTASIPEVVGGSAQLFDPQRSESLEQNLRDLLDHSSLRQELSKKGFENVRRFSWEKCARETLEVFEQVNRQKSASLTQT